MSDQGEQAEVATAGDTSLVRRGAHRARRGHMRVRSGFGVFKSWHTEDDKLWREIYARTVATLLAAFIAYLIAVVAAGADPKPLKFILLVGALALLAIGGIYVIRGYERLMHGFLLILNREGKMRLALRSFALYFGAVTITAVLVVAAMYLIGAYMDKSVDQVNQTFGRWLIFAVVGCAFLIGTARSIPTLMDFVRRRETAKSEVPGAVGTAVSNSDS